jgi:hypothetical protein
MRQTLPPGLPPSSEATYRSFLESEPRERAELLEDLEEYMAHLYSLDPEVVDLATAAKLGAALQELIETSDQEQLAHVEAATLYFVDEEDQEGDTSAPVGFDDDVAVFNAVCQFLARKDLMIRL